MTRFAPGDRVRIDIPDETDPDHERYHGCEGTVVELLADAASEETGNGQGATIYRAGAVSTVYRHSQPSNRDRDIYDQH